MTTHTAITDYYAGATLDNGSLLCHRTTDATVKTASATAETSSGSGVFTAVFTDVAAGSYRLKLKSGGEVVATRDVYFAGTDGETVQTGVRAELDSATQAQINTIDDIYTVVQLTDADVSLIKPVTDKLNFNSNDAVNANVTYYNDTPQSNGDIPLKIDAVYARLGAPTGATLANQVLILEELDALAAIQLAAVEVDAGTITGFPETLIIGDSYSEDTGQIRIDIKDSITEDPIDVLGSLEFVDADVVFTAFRPNDSARIVGTCQYVREPSSGTLTASYVLVTLLTSETAKGKAEYTYEGRLKFVWQGPSSSDETDEEQKTYKTTPFKFIANP